MSVEPDAPPTTRIFIYMVLLAALVLGVVVGLFQLFKQQTRSLIYEKELSLENKALLEQQALDHQRLAGYAELDRDRGIYQIPIDSAFDKLVAHPGLIKAIGTAPPAGPSSQPASLPASQPASSGR